MKYDWSEYIHKKINGMKTLRGYDIGSGKLTYQQGNQLDFRNRERM